MMIRQLASGEKTTLWGDTHIAPPSSSRRCEPLRPSVVRASRVSIVMPRSPRPRREPARGWSIGKSNGLFHRRRAPTLLPPRATGRLPNPAPGGWPCALPAARRPQDG
jgi:hypothetical protein